MKMNWLYDFNKWPETVPMYRLTETQHFLFSYLTDIGFDKRPSYIKRHRWEMDSNAAHIKLPCYPLESKNENS